MGHRRHRVAVSAARRASGRVPARCERPTGDERARVAAGSGFGLAAYFDSRDSVRNGRVAEALEYGIVGINEGISATEVEPCGGMKESGIGREGAHHGLDEFLEVKYMCMGGLDR